MLGVFYGCNERLVSREDDATTHTHQLHGRRQNFVEERARARQAGGWRRAACDLFAPEIFEPCLDVLPFATPAATKSFMP